MARTSDRSKMLKAKEAQRTEINKELCFPLSAGPEHCHRTYQEHFTPTVYIYTVYCHYYYKIIMYTIYHDAIHCNDNCNINCLPTKIDYRRM